MLCVQKYKAYDDHLKGHMPQFCMTYLLLQVYKIVFISKSLRGKTVLYLTNSILRNKREGKTLSFCNYCVIQVFSIRILMVDDGSPILEVNTGIQYLELDNGQVFPGLLWIY